MQKPQISVAPPDRYHAEPAVAFANQGYAMLLEKPMATNPADCRRIVEAVEQNHILFAVFHDFCYFNYAKVLKETIDSGLIEEVVSIKHLEPVGYWHYAHSYVRGNWRNEATSSSMLLAKSCHDIDWLRYILGQRCVQVSSFGSLTHFKKSQKPAGDALRHPCGCALSVPGLRLRGAVPLFCQTLLPGAPQERGIWLAAGRDYYPG